MRLGLGLGLPAMQGGGLSAIIAPFLPTGASPSNVMLADFPSETFASMDTQRTFGGLFTHSRAGNATVVDSDGVIKWAPHNLLSWSEDFSVPSAWSAGGSSTATGTTFTCDANANHVLFSTSPVSSPADSIFTSQVEIKISTGQWVTLEVWEGGAQTGVHGWFDLANGVKGTLSADAGYDAVSSSIEALPDGYYRIKVQGSRTAGGNIYWAMRFADGDGVYGFTTVEGNSAEIRKASFHRSGLGGMADNPETGDSYVPTTSGARYLARTMNHIPDGAGGWTGPLALMEPQATNLVLNSDTLSTQGVTVTAEPHTLHFTGTGTVTLSGVATDGPLVGTGTGEDNRVSLTFTPSAGTLTLTVSGTVTNAQLEAGSVPTSYIPTAGSQVTRAVDSLSIDSSVTGLTASDTAISIHMDGYMTYADFDHFNTVRFMQIGNGSDPTLSLYLSTSGARTGDVNAQQAGSTFWGINGPDTSYSPGVDVPFDIAARYTDSALNIAIDGTAETEVATTEFPSPLQGHDMQIATAGVLNIKTLVIAYEDWGNAGIAEITT